MAFLWIEWQFCAQAESNFWFIIWFLDFMYMDMGVCVSVCVTREECLEDMPKKVNNISLLLPIMPPYVHILNINIVYFLGKLLLW